eukprot:TRINITY_DN92786_c0_g1_i1.p1 TRINITY_DN92786_c0_g1~~TRINITY_DN92786_c0_g1_i1.p1  ORF type:complete len:250 (-),score=62.25 TRINITY_DN92786_c0_g1_i1:103-852(-)
MSGAASSGGGGGAKAAVSKKAKKDFAPSSALPVGNPTLVDEDDVIDRYDEVNVQLGPVPKFMSHTDAARKTLPSTYTGNLRHAGDVGGKKARRLLKSTAKRMDANVKEAAVERPEPPEIGSVKFEDFQIRKVFNILDLDKNGVIDAAELRHVFAQLGEMPNEAHLNGMINMCDPRGEGVVAYEDFSQVFLNPVEALRNVNAAELKAVLTNVPKEDSEGDYSGEDEDEGEESDDLTPSGSEDGDALALQG